jgi:hypothetical protein
VDCIFLAQDRDQWQILVNMINEHSSSIKKAGNFLTS